MGGGAVRCLPVGMAPALRVHPAMAPRMALEESLRSTLKTFLSSSPSSLRGVARNPTSRLVSHSQSCRPYTAAEPTSPDLVALEYADLNLTRNVSQERGHLRIRQHVNPLKASVLVGAELPDWNAVFMDATLPLMVDIGSGSGRFLLWLAKRDSDPINYLGLDIRRKLVKRAKAWAREMALSNIHFMFANATVSFEQLVSAYPGSLKAVSILCPDPHFKKRHHKRRVVQKPLVDSIVSKLMPGGQVFIQSDVLEVAVDMRNQFDAVQYVDSISPGVPCDAEGWLLNNPMGKRTEREIHAEYHGAKVYRRMYIKSLGCSSIM